MKRALVTGGAGFLGLHLTDALLARGARVRVLDNFSCSSRENYRPYRRKVELIEGDIRDPRAVARAVRGVDAVFHLAAIRSVVKTVEDPVLSHEVNATGALLLLDAAARARVRSFVFTSSSAVYGDARLSGRQAGRVQRENIRPAPISPYGTAKLAAEHYARYYWLSAGLGAASIRIFNVYGPRQNPDSKYSLAVPGLLSKILAGKAPVIDGSGEQSRDFVYVDDVVRALLLAASKPRARGESFNVGSGVASSVNRLASHLLRLVGARGLRPKHGPRRPGDPEVTRADVGKIRSVLGWKPRVGLEEGLRRTVEWARTQGLRAPRA